MASRRRGAAAATNMEELRLKSPAMRRKRRSSRRSGSRGKAAAPEGPPEAEAPASPRLPPETNSYKTPKRTRAGRSHLATFSSPANEADVQQEIFWDPQSPIAYKLGSEQKKQTVNRHAVEISEIVNRIAPQDEKPACNEGNLLGFWIGDDAIPCTPAIPKVRPRRKINGARGHQSKHREEELIELAKQFDKNLTDAIQDQNSPCHTITHSTSEVEKSTELEDEPGMKNQQQFLEENPKANAAFGTVGRSTKALEPCEDSRQEPFDLDAEIALNELFDGPTQECTGRLSPDLSDCSSNSNFHEKQNMLLEENITAASKQATGEASLREGTAALLTECVATIPAPNSKGISEQIAPKVGSCTTGFVVSSEVDRIVSDDFDDWGDDSFLMQITQNPEVIIIHESPLPHVSGKNVERKESTVVSVQDALFHSFKNNPASSALQKQSIDTGNTERVLLHTNLTIKTDKTKFISTNGGSKIACYNPLPVKPGTKSKREGFTQLKCPARGSFPEKTSLSVSEPSTLPKPQIGKYGSSMSSIDHQSSLVSSSVKVLNIRKASGPDSACHLKQKELPKNSAFSFEDWDEPKFSDEVLDLFCESDSLWDTNGDDDLFCQVCDDVEKNSLSQKVVKEKEKATPTLGSASKLEVSSFLTVANQGISNCPLTQKSHMGRKTFSLGTPVKIATLPKNENCTDPVQPNWQAFKAESTNCIRGKWSRSHSVPGTDFGSGSSSAALSNSCLNDCNIQWQNGLSNMDRVPNNSNINQLPTEKSKYVFRKTNPSQTLVLDYRSVNVGQTLETVPGLGENKNAPNIQFPPANQTNMKPPFKRHLSDSLAQYETEQKSTKCSQEEIARKKQEALERRRCKMQALLKNTAPT